MKRRLVSASLVLGLGLASALADEVDALVREARVPARFADERAVFSVEECPVTFTTKAGPEERRWRLVRDRGKVVAVITQDAIHLVAFRPDEARDRIEFPRGRWHIDTMLGAAIATGSFLPGSTVPEGGEYAQRIEGEGTGQVTVTRSYHGPRTERRKTGGTETSLVQTVRATNRFLLRLDPVHGYLVEGTYRITLEDPPASHQFTNLLCEGTFALWPGRARGERTVFTPVGGGFEGYANNLQAIDLSDNARPVIRNGGFGAYLHESSGWSPAMTLDGADADFVICNAHADIDFVARWPVDPATGARLRTFEVRHRLLALPPEITRKIWQEMNLRFADKSTVTISIGSRETFENQPLPATESRRGLINTAGLRLAAEGRGGGHALVVRGRVWPNLPQIALEPSSRYRVSGWFRVSDQKTDPAGPSPQASIQADLYEWSPHTSAMDRVQKTPPVGPSPDWQFVELTFRTPDWDPFVNIVFQCENGEALLDDFLLEKLP